MALEAIVVPALLLAHLAVPAQAAEALCLGGIGDRFPGEVGERGEGMVARDGGSKLTGQPSGTRCLSDIVLVARTYGVPALALGMTATDVGTRVGESGSDGREEDQDRLARAASFDRPQLRRLALLVSLKPTSHSFSRQYGHLEPTGQQAASLGFDRARAWRRRERMLLTDARQAPSYPFACLAPPPVNSSLSWPSGPRASLSSHLTTSKRATPAAAWLPFHQSPSFNWSCPPLAGMQRQPHRPTQVCLHRAAWAAIPISKAGIRPSPSLAIDLGGSSIVPPAGVRTLPPAGKWPAAPTFRTRGKEPQRPFICLSTALGGVPGPLGPTKLPQNTPGAMGSRWRPYRRPTSVAASSFAHPPRCSGRTKG